MPQQNNIHDCIKLCWECRTACEKTLFQHCLIKGGKHVEAAHVQLMIGCIDICQTAADFMTRGSAVHASVCAACADVCEACAESCAAIDSPEMKHCADICRRCAESCRTMGEKMAA